jgi:DNA-directed RNA polymerase subunit beta'
MSVSLFSPTSSAVRPPRSLAAAFGLWYATRAPSGDGSRLRPFASAAHVEAALSQGTVSLFTPIRVRLEARAPVDTTAGRVLLAGAVRAQLPFSLFNRAIDVRARARLLEAAGDLRGVHAAELLEADLDRFGLAFADPSGVSLAADDLRAPLEKPDLLAAALAAVKRAQQAYDDGEITDGERYGIVIGAWAGATDQLEDAARRGASPDQPLGALLAAGVVAALDARRCTAAVGPVSKPSGEVVETPAIHGLAEGLTPHEHFLTATTARAHTVSRFFRQESARDLGRRLLAVLGDLRVTEVDCGAVHGRTLGTTARARRVVAPLRERALGRTALTDVWSPHERARLLLAGAAISADAAERLHDHVVPTLAVRSILDCETRGGVCQRCYGWDPRTRGPVVAGARVGLLASRAVTEAAGELVHRTMHICGATAFPVMFSPGDATSRAGTVRWCRIDAEPRVDAEGFVMMGDEGRLDLLDEVGLSLESFRVRKGDHVLVPDGASVPRAAGVVSYPWWDTPIVADLPRGATAIVRSTSAPGPLDEVTGLASRVAFSMHLEARLVDGTTLVLPVPLPPGARLVVSDGSPVHRGEVLALDRERREPDRDHELRDGLPGLVDLLDVARPSPRALLAGADATVRFVESRPHPRYRALLRLDPAGGARPSYCRAPRDRALLVDDGDSVVAGQALTGGSRDHRDLLRIWGPRRLADHLLHEMLALFLDADLRIAEQHLELAVREMLRHARVDDPGDTALAVGSVIPRTVVHDENAAAAARGARAASSTPLLLGVTELAERQR